MVFESTYFSIRLILLSIAIRSFSIGVICELWDFLLMATCLAFGVLVLASPVASSSMLWWIAISWVYIYNIKLKRATSYLFLSKMITQLAMTLRATPLSKGPTHPTRRHNLLDQHQTISKHQQNSRLKIYSSPGHLRVYKCILQTDSFFLYTTDMLNRQTISNTHLEQNIRFRREETTTYSKTCPKQHLKIRPKICFKDRLLLNSGQTYCRMLQVSILQYFRLALSYHLLSRSLFCLFLSGRFKKALLYLCKSTRNNRFATYLSLRHLFFFLLLLSGSLRQVLLYLSLLTVNEHTTLAVIVNTLKDYWNLLPTTHRYVMFMFFTSDLS